MARRRRTGKKKAWNMTNPLYRYLHRGGGSYKKLRRKRQYMGSGYIARGGSVARYKRRSRRSSGFGLGGSGLLKKAAFGAAAGFALGMFLPQFNNTVGKAAAGFFAGGPVGAVAAVMAPKLLGGVGGSTAGTADASNGWL